ncbi:glycosyltransferase [Bacteroides congonensis]|uniref:glycosyltransferase n=1 Tax=Bacteroides congonensis TaxID=1871006 RepID=UPI003A850126
MRKLLMIGSSLNYGSPGKITESLGLLARKQGWEVYQAHGLKYSNPSQLMSRPVSSAMGEMIHAIHSLLLDAHGLASTSETKNLVQWIEEIKPDVIHLHNLHGYYLNYKVLFEYLATIDTPIVWTLHDFWPITGHCAHFDYVGCTKWKTKCYHCPQKGTYPKSLFLDRSRKNFIEKKKAFTSVKNMTITPVSKWVGSLVAESFLRKYPIKPIYNGIDVDIFKPTDSDLRDRLGLKGKFVMVGVAAPWYPLKGMNDYFDLSKRLSSDFQIIMIGLKFEQIKNLPTGIIGIEKTQNQRELAEYYSMADVVLNLSYQETFGMTTVEGMACGTPGIVYDTTASPELITDETGMVVEAGDIDKLLLSILDIRKKGKEKYSVACRNRAIICFNKDKQFSEYIKLYYELTE